jgi:phenylpropionate dioxygenase-like ring-hydroxylating dioxygenase large terminal subunit
VDETAPNQALNNAGVEDAMGLIQQYNDAAAAMLSYVETNTTDQSNEIMAVPAKAYTDPVRWQKEIDLIFKKLPLMLAFSIELPNPGDYKTIEVTGMPVLLTRGKDGKARAFLNVCTHRGAPVAEAAHGNCSRFVCPYHGWTYNNEGKLLGIADRQKFGELDTSTRNLRALPCEERAGLIFAILTPGLPIDLEEFLGGMLEDLESLNLETYHFCGSKEIFGANWKIAYDGYLEGYHFAVAHPETIFKRTHTNVMRYDMFGPHYRIGFPNHSITKLHEIDKTEWGAQENSAFDFVRTLFPNISIFLAPELGQIAQLIPGPTPAENRTILNYVSKSPPKSDESLATLQTMIQFFRDVTNDEDYLLGLKVQKGLDSGALDSVIFGKNEYGNQYFHKWVDYYLQNDPAAPRPIPLR